MSLMKKIAIAICVAASAFCCNAFASITNPESGKEYRVLAQPQPTETPGKIEVIEFFAYWCPHCNVLDPILADWVNKKGAAISFRRVHIDFNNQQPPQRLFYTLEAMGKEEALHAKIFKAIHVEHKFLRTDDDMLHLVTDYGLDPKQYLETSRSFAVTAKMARAKNMQAPYGVNEVGVPTIIVDGRYMTSPGFIRDLYPPMDDLEGSRNMIPVLDYLVQKAQKEHVAKK